jgi:cytidylate kinase
MPVITIRGQMGSGAPEIGRIVADKLGIDYVDRQIISDVANRIKCSLQSVQEKESPPGTLIGRIAEALGRTYPVGSYNSGTIIDAYTPIYEAPLNDTHYFAGLISVIKQIAESQAVVIRGRGSQFILKEFPGILHVLTVAEEKIRVKRILESRIISESEVRKEINRSDSSHREFIKRYFQAELEDPVNYELVINPLAFGYEDSAEIIIKALQLKLSRQKADINPQEG